MALLILLTLGALAGDGFDGHGLKPVPSLGAPLDLQATWRPSDGPGRAVAVTGLLERSEGNLVEVVVDWDGVHERRLLDDVVALNLGVRAELGPRAALAVSLPLFLASDGAAGPQGPSAGDLRIAAPLGVVLPEGRGLGLAVVPFADLPSGDESSLLGAAGPGGGALLAAGLHGLRATIDTNLGLERRAETTWQNQPGGSYALASAGVAFAPTSWIGFKLETTYRQPLSAPSSATSQRGATRPGEALAGVGGVGPGGLRWSVGGAAGLTQGAGAARWRLYGGLGYAMVEDRQRDGDHDGIGDAADACPERREVDNGWRDEDGCPDALASWTLSLVNPEGSPVPGATLRVGQAALISDGDGRVRLTDLPPDVPLTGTVRAEGYLTAAFHTRPLPEGESQQVLQVAWLPGTARFAVVDPEGEAIEARVRLSGPGVSTERTLPGGEPLQIQLAPGRWTMEISAAGYGPVKYELEMKADQGELTRVDVTLYPTKKGER